ncbi:hypothetical protein N9L47_12805 [Rhodobacteraceae bacterium]|nr:hypothetical protein [Paracoccaceae bacterium]
MAGVRDATRYAARTLDQDICVGESNGGGGVINIARANSPDVYYTMVERSLLNEVDVLPTNVRLRRVISSYRCVVEPGNYRQIEVPIVRIQARLEIILPLGEVLELNNGPVLDRILTDLDEESRIFGL